MLSSIETPKNKIADLMPFKSKLLIATRVSRLTFFQKLLAVVEAEGDKPSFKPYVATIKDGLGNMPGTKYQLTPDELEILDQVSGFFASISGAPNFRDTMIIIEELFSNGIAKYGSKKSLPSKSSTLIIVKLIEPVIHTPMLFSSVELTGLFIRLIDYTRSTILKSVDERLMSMGLINQEGKLTKKGEDLTYLLIEIISFVFNIKRKGGININITKQNIARNLRIVLKVLETEQ
jgi:hypothetical protein